MDYIDEVKKDLKNIGAQVELAPDRRACMQLVGEAKDCAGFQWPQE